MSTAVVVDTDVVSYLSKAIPSPTSIFPTSQTGRR